MALVAAAVASPSMASLRYCCPAPTMCCGRDGGGGALVSGLWKQASCRGWQGLIGPSLGRGMLSRFLAEPVEQSAAKRRDEGWQVNVAADQSGSKPDASERSEKCGYHPLEELSKLEKEEMLAANGRPTAAAIARTVAEVNWYAAIFASLVSDEDPVFGTEVQYLVDEHGDLYFEMNDDNEFLSNLSSAQTSTVLIGFRSMDEVQLAHLIEEEGDDDDEDISDFDEEDGSNGGSSDDDLEDFNVQFWDEGLPGVADAFQGSLSPESLGALNVWGGSETLTWVHPLDFATKMAQAAAADHIEDFARPSKRLTVKGVVRRITDEEETYVRSLWFDRFLWDEDNEEEEEEEEEVEQSGERLREPGTAQDTQAHLKLVDRPTSATKELHQAPVGKIVTDPASSDTKKVAKNKIERRMQEVISSEIAESATAEASGTSTSDSTNGSDVTRRDRSAGSPRVWLRNGQAADMGSETESSETDDEDHERSENSEVEEDDTIMEWTVEVNGEVGTSFYKLEMMSLQLDSFSGVQASIDIQAFCDSEPDILAHSAAAIAERVNSAGSKTDRALKALCKRERGLNVEEVSVIGIDSLGVDLRVSCGIEVQTLRFQFARRATSEKNAEQLLDQLINPRFSHKRPRKSQQPPRR
ncbi:unnamed protein product [Sphagnum troendelagicum]|uniref:FMN-binding split barrel n=1 Tax=Sphagnum troendelagicum TaxID=128251 RepID=A0ABP0V1T2_9BRYO